MRPRYVNHLNSLLFLLQQLSNFKRKNLKCRSTESPGIKFCVNGQVFVVLLSRNSLEGFVFLCCGALRIT